MPINCLRKMEKATSSVNTLTAAFSKSCLVTVFICLTLFCRGALLSRRSFVVALFCRCAHIAALFCRALICRALKCRRFRVLNLDDTTSKNTTFVRCELELLEFTKRNNQTETQRLTCHPQMLTTRPFALRHRAEPVRKKKIAKVTCRTPNQPPEDSKIDIENGRGRWRHSRSNKEKKMETPGRDKRKLCSPLLCRPFSRHVGPRPRASRSLRLVPVKSGEIQKKKENLKIVLVTAKQD
jgi:hypothetical protein